MVMTMSNKDYFKIKRGPITEVYNGGIISFYEKEVLKDKFGTPINRYNEKLISEDWYRYLGLTAQDIYYARADDKQLTVKIAIKGQVNIDVKWRATLNDVNGKTFEVYRSFYNYRRDETELSLMEVRS